MNKDRTVWVDTSIFLGLKRSRNRILVSLRSLNVALIHLASHQWSEMVAEVNPNETGPSSAWRCQAETENHAARTGRQIFTNMSPAKYALTQNYTKKSSKSALTHHSVRQHSQPCAVYFILNILKHASDVKENTSQLSSSPHQYFHNPPSLG